MAEDDGRPVTAGAAPLPAGSASSAGSPASATASAAPGPEPDPDEADGGAAPDTRRNGVVVSAVNGTTETNGSTAPVDGDGVGAVATASASAADDAAAADRGRGEDRARRRGRRRRQGRGRPPSPLLDIRGRLPGSVRVVLGTLGLASVMGLWLWASSRETKGIVVPSPAETFAALRELHEDGVLWDDLLASGSRILYGYSISMAIGVVVGLLMGSVVSVEAYFEAPIGFMRYIPAGALSPLMILWLGIDEAPKITLIVIGTVFFNILMVADVARAVPRELIEASYTLGARRWTVLSRIVFRHSIPGMVDVARINLAAGWLMLVVAELLAADEGLAVRIIKVQRLRGYDTMFAVLLVFGMVGILSDLLLRWLRNRSAPWARP